MVGYPPAEDGNTTLQLLGSFELWRGAQRVPLAPAAQRLLAFLALRHGMTARGYVAGVLWIDYSQDAANANLRTALWRLRKLRSPVVETSATHLSLASRVAVDLREAAEVARRASDDGSELLPSEIEGILLAGDVLPDWYEDWVVMERERFRQLRLHALETLCYALARKRRYGKAIEVGLAAVVEEPLRESAHRAVMRVHLAEGNRNEALRQYEWCRRGLIPLGLEPTAETQRLRERCAIGDGAVTIPC